jgi:hypothetical protein
LAIDTDGGGVVWFWAKVIAFATVSGIIGGIDTSAATLG